MDENIYYEKVLNRILQGRLRIRVGDLVLFIYEPSREIIEESFDIYDDAREKAYFSGCYLEDEVINLLVENDIWTPRDDKQAEETQKEIERLKVQAFQSFFRKKELATLKRKIRRLESQYVSLKSKRTTLEHLTCDGVAQFARRCWIIAQTTQTADGDKYDFSKIGVKDLLERYSSNTLLQKDIRKVANLHPWRAMWNSSKKRGDVFGKSSIELSHDQLTLVTFSQMYDNVYEHPDQPVEAIIEDDDCLDGWFIVQKEKSDKERKSQQAEGMLSEKVAGSQEIMLMAKSQEEAQEIYGLNSASARNIVHSRQEQIRANEGNGNISFKDLADVKQDRMMNAVNQQTAAIKGRGK